MIYIHASPYTIEVLPKERIKYKYDSRGFNWNSVIKVHNSLYTISFNIEHYFPFKCKSISFGQFNKREALRSTLNDSLILSNPPLIKEYLRTSPDRQVYIPKGGIYYDEDNERFLVQKSKDNSKLYAVWTQSAVVGYGNNRIMFSKSTDGKVWETPLKIAGCNLNFSNQCQASWEFLVQAAHSERICIFYTKEMPLSDIRQHSGELGIYYSDDEGNNWVDGGFMTMPRDKYDNSNIEYPKNWIVWQLPIRDNKGKQIVGFSQWDTFELKNKEQKRKWWTWAARSKLIRFDNIDSGPDHKEITILPEDENGLEVNHPFFDWSVCEEPSIVLLPDNRLFLIARTYTGYIWYSTSSDNGTTWLPMEKLRYSDDEEYIKQPRASAPIFKLDDGRFVLVFHNNDGVKNGYNQLEKEWKINHLNYIRNPAFISLGRFKKEGKQPIWFNKPIKILDTDDITIPPRESAEVATYPSLTQWKGETILWYPDKKHYLLGIKLDKYLE